MVHIGKDPPGAVDCGADQASRLTTCNPDAISDVVDVAIGPRSGRESGRD
jgi:hypothetical protein